MGTQKVTPCLIFAISVATIGSFQYGYNTGVINAPEAIIKDFLNYTLEKRLEGFPSDGFLRSLWSLSVAIFFIGGVIGSCSVELFVNCFGRCNSMLVVNLLAIAGGCLMGFCKMAGSVEMLILGRLIIGIFCGLCTGFVPMYIGEISPIALRGAFGTLNQLGVVMGILVAQIFGLDVILGSAELWPGLLAFPIIPAILQSVALPFCPESPRFLLVNRKDEEGAKGVLQQLWGTHDVTADIQEMKDEGLRVVQEKQVTVLELFRPCNYCQPLFISLVLQLSPQLSGINAVFCYSIGIFKDAGVQEPIYATIAIGVVNAIFPVVSLFLVKRAGRRTLHMTGLGGMALSSILVTVSLLLKDEYNAMSFVCIAAVLTYVAFFEIGPGPIPWSTVAEPSSQGPHPAATAMAGCSNWTANFLVGLLFPLAASYLGAYVFIVFTAFLIVFLIFTFFKVPETRGRTFEGMMQAFEGQAQEANRSGKGSMVEMTSIQPVREATTKV